MTKKEMIVVIGIILFFIIILFFVNKNKIRKKSEENSQNSVRTEYNEDEERYLVYDETGNEIYNGTNRAEAEFRQRHPDFNPGFEELDQNMIPTEIVEN